MQYAYVNGEHFKQRWLQRTVGTNQVVCHKHTQICTFPISYCVHLYQQYFYTNTVTNQTWTLTKA